MRTAARFYSKATPGSSIWTSDAASKQEKTTESMRVFAAKLIGPRHKQLVDILLNKGEQMAELACRSPSVARESARCIEHLTAIA
jgi:hypothetical protein